MKEFLEFIEQNEEAKAKVAELDAKADAKFEDFAAIAKEYGFDISDDDFVPVGGELSEDELDSVVGGDLCYCFGGGGGTGDPDTNGDGGEPYKELTCACVLGGGGEYYNDKGKKFCRCWCVFAGTGNSAWGCDGGAGEAISTLT